MMGQFIKRQHLETVVMMTFSHTPLTLAVLVIVQVALGHGFTTLCMYIGRYVHGKCRENMTKENVS